MSVKELEAEILKLDVKDRISLIESLLLSLDDLDDAENLRLWADEAAKRAARLERGEGRTIPAEEVYARVRAIIEK